MTCQERRVGLGQSRGVVLVAVLVAMLIVTSFVVVWTRSAIREQRQLRMRERQVQAAWLAEAGLERAAARLRRSADYRGETWSIAAEQLDRPSGASVTIRVEADPQQPTRRIVRVQADYPDDPTRRVRHSKQVVVDLSRQGDQS